MSLRRKDDNLTLQDAAGCLRAGLGIAAFLIGFLFLTTVSSAVNAWSHRKGYQPTNVVFSESSLSRTKITIAATGEALYLRGMSDVPKGPRTVLYNPAARATFLGLGVSDDRIIVSMNRDLGREAMFTTAGTLGCMSAAWLLLTRKRERKTRS